MESDREIREYARRLAMKLDTLEWQVGEDGRTWAIDEHDITWYIDEEGKRYHEQTCTDRGKEHTFRVYESAVPKGFAVLKWRLESRLASLTAEEARALADAADSQPTPEEGS